MAARLMVLAVRLSDDEVVMPPATSKSLFDVSDKAPEALIPLELTVKAWLFVKLTAPTLLA